MKVSLSPARRVIVLGATGMIGGIALRELLAEPTVSEITLLTRRPIGIRSERIREIIHSDFADYGSVADTFANQDAALFCLGAYTGAVPDHELARVTVDYLLAFAKALHARSPKATFCLLSGQGADPSGRSPAAFARYKGRAETELLALGFSRTHIFRPGYIYPVEPRREPNIGYRILRALYPVLRHLYPNIGLPSDDLARAMVHVGIYGAGSHLSPVLENRDIRALAASIR